MDKQQRRQTWWIVGLVIVAVAIDQALKLYVHSHLMLGESIEITPFFQLCYVENDGMAFGIEWFDKFFLTLFRLLAVGALGYYIHQLIHPKRDENKFSFAYLSMIGLVMAGALGNIVDCVFYGKVFGYANWFYGRVVDMLYFPLITNSAGECLFFRPVFNFADSCITVAVIAILIWFRDDLNRSLSDTSLEK